MIRTQIYLPELTYDQIKEYAHEERKSMAETIRELINLSLAKIKPRKKKKHFWELLAELKADGPKDGSINHDKYIYDNPHNL